MSDKPIINLMNANTQKVLAALREAQAKAEKVEVMVIAQDARIVTLTAELAIVRGLVTDIQVKLFDGGPTV